MTLSGEKPAEEKTRLRLVLGGEGLMGLGEGCGCVKDWDVGMGGRVMAGGKGAMCGGKWNWMWDGVVLLWCAGRGGCLGP